jgi:glycosyltransferase involved in cell wall biosynthesis
MRIVFLLNSPYPSQHSKRFSLYKRGLEENGSEVSIVSVYRQKKSFLSTYADFLIIPFKARRNHHEQIRKADVVLVGGFSWFSYFMFKIWYGTGRRKLIYELNEKPGTEYTSRFGELKIIKKTGLFLNQMAMKVFDGFIVISEPLYEYISARKKNAASIIKIPIIIDTKENFDDGSTDIPAHPYFIHTGAMSQQKDGIVDIFSAFAQVVARTGLDLHFYLSGKREGPSDVLDGISQIIDRYNLQDKVHFLGYIGEDMLRSLQKHSKFLVLPKPDNEQNRNNFATKLGEYLAFGKPVITTAVGDMANYMKHEQTSIIVEPGNVDQITDAMIRIIDNDELACDLGLAGKKVAEKYFEYKVHGRRLSEYLLGLISA